MLYHSIKTRSATNRRSGEKEEQDRRDRMGEEFEKRAEKVVFIVALGTFETDSNELLPSRTVSIGKALHIHVGKTIN